MSQALWLVVVAAVWTGVGALVVAHHLSRQAARWSHGLAAMAGLRPAVVELRAGRRASVEALKELRLR